jgi:CHAT domain-containing protein
LDVRKHMLQALAYAHLGRLTEADQNLQQAERLCDAHPCEAAGEVARIGGAVEIERGDSDGAEKLFRQSLQFARKQGDKFLELSALLNLGVVAIGREHFDESIDWSKEAYTLSDSLGDNLDAEKALGNLAWAYYKMGDFDQSLLLSMEATQRARNLGVVIDEVEWLNNVGLIYSQTNQLPLAEKYYQQSLALARRSHNRQQTAASLSALAFLSVRTRRVALAKQYSREALELAKDVGDQEAASAALLAEAQIAAIEGNQTWAEQVLVEVARDPKGDISLRWEAENELAKLYEHENRPDDAENQFRLALTTVGNARSSLHQEDLRLPFLANAAHLYDDYIHFLLEHGRVDDALGAADYSRAQTLAEGLGISRKVSALDRNPLHARQVARRSDAAILFYWLGPERSYLWAVTPKGTTLFQLPAASEITGLVERYRKALVGPRDVLDSANQDGGKLYDILVAPAQKVIGPNSRVVIIPDGSLNDLNFETLFVPEQKPHYWIEDVTIINASSLGLLAASHRPRKSGTKILLMGDAVAPNREYGDLPQAAAEMENIEEHFNSADRIVYARGEATPPAYLSSHPQQFSYVHFVAHGTASRLSPLDSAIVLSKSTEQEDSFKLYARDIIRHPLDADLVTISTCYGAGARAYAGEGLVGLSWAFLRAGAHNVIGALWEVSDVSTPQLMGTLYGELKKGHRPEAALRTAKLSLLHSSGVFRKPFYWAPFQVYTGS